MSLSKLDEYKDQVLSLYAEGLGSEKVALRLASDHGLEISSRSVRRAKKRWMAEEDSITESILQDKNHDPKDWTAAWVKTDDGSVYIKNKSHSVSIDQIREDLLNDLKGYSPEWEAIERIESTKDSHCLIIDIADLHIGKYASALESGEDYGVDMAVNLAWRGVVGILDKASSYNLDKIVFVVGNDVLHIDGPNNTTTAGTRQDVDKIWHENFQAAKNLYVGIVGHLVDVADVHIMHNPSNHDCVTGYMLADTLFSWYRNHPNITFDVSMAHRKYFTYGLNLISTSHGDGAKMEDTPLIMANEAPMDWAKTRFRYIYLHHLHHMKKTNFLSGKDYHGATVEYLRSVSYTDSWHHRNGYQHAPKCVTGFIHHKEFGQVARLTHLFK